MANTSRVVAGPPRRKPREEWPVTCDCGWEQAVQGVGARSREFAEGWGRGHLRDRHGADNNRQVVRRKVLTIDGVDERLLTKQERARYSELVREANTLQRLDPRGGPVVSWRETVRTTSYWLGMPLWIVVFCGALAGVFVSDGRNSGMDRTSAAETMSVIAITAVMLVGLPLLIVWAFRDRRAVVAKRVDDYLDRIGFGERTHPPRRRRSGTGGGYKTKRQMQHEWYDDHSELDWRDRVMAETLGLDADTYVSNFLEHDKD